MDVQKLKEKVERIKMIQQRRLDDKESTTHVNNVLALTVGEAEFLFSQIKDN